MLGRVVRLAAMVPRVMGVDGADEDAERRIRRLRFADIRFDPVQLVAGVRTVAARVETFDVVQRRIPQAEVLLAGPAHPVAQRPQMIRHVLHARPLDLHRVGQHAVVVRQQARVEFRAKWGALNRSALMRRLLI